MWRCAIWIALARRRVVCAAAGAAPLKWSTPRDSIIPSEGDQKMAGKRDKPEEIVAKLRQVEVLQGQGQSIADAVRQIGVTQQTCY
jgi:hypothetical protein